MKLTKTFYRVGKEDCSGLWYDQQGNYHGLIHNLELSNKTLPMPYDKDIVGWLSAADSLGELKNWFNDDDMKILEPLGYKILKYKTYTWKKHNGHYVIKQDKSCLIK